MKNFLKLALILAMLCPFLAFGQGTGGNGIPGANSGSGVTPATVNGFRFSAGSATTDTAATSAQGRALICSGTPLTNYYCDGATGAWTPIPWTVNTNANLAQYSTFASVASTPAMLFTGAIYAGGTGTTTTPHWYINQGATAPTTWSVNGTHFGVNAAVGFSGNFLDFRINGSGSPLFSVSSIGAVTVGGNTIYMNGGSSYIQYTGGQFRVTQPISSLATTGGFVAPLYTPASSSATCTVGTVAWDANYDYTCTATNTWKRTPLFLNSGTVTLSSGSTTSPSVTLVGTYAAAPSCSWDTQNATATVKASLGVIAPQSTTTTTSATVQTAAGANVTLQYSCPSPSPTTW